MLTDIEVKLCNVLAASIVQGHEEKEQWIEHLRSIGVKAAHPDDGWVNNEQNSFNFTYPHFNDGVEVGDLIMLGWANSRQKLVRVIKRGRHSVLPNSYVFRDEWFFELIKIVRE